MFTPDSKWRLIGFEEQEFEVSEAIPSLAFLKKTGMQALTLDDMWGRVELEGRLNVKINDTAYTAKFFNLRKRALLLYSMVEPEFQQQQ